MIACGSFQKLYQYQRTCIASKRRRNGVGKYELARGKVVVLTIDKKSTGIHSGTDKVPISGLGPDRGQCPNMVPKKVFSIFSAILHFGANSDKKTGSVLFTVQSSLGVEVLQVVLK